MAMNRIQFQEGLSLPEFMRQFGAEDQCEKALESARWPNGFHCPRCENADYGVIHGRRHKRFQCRSCRYQATLTAGTIMEATKLPLTIWFLAFYLISQAKTGIAAMSLRRQLGVSYPTALMLHHKIMHAMGEREKLYVLSGTVQIDDAYLGGELPGGKAGRGSENKVPFVAAVSLSQENHPIYIKFKQVEGFTSEAILKWGKECLSPASRVMSDGLACFRSVTKLGCAHDPVIAGGRHPQDQPEFKWINTIIGNLKTSLSGVYHAFSFDKYADRYFAAFNYRFNRRFHLASLPNRLLIAAVNCKPCPGRQLWRAESPC